MGAAPMQRCALLLLDVTAWLGATVSLGGVFGALRIRCAPKTRERKGVGWRGRQKWQTRNAETYDEMKWEGKGWNGMEWDGVG